MNPAKSSPYADLDARARALLTALMDAARDGELGRDHLMLSALERPLLSLIGALARANVADAMGVRRHLSSARSALAEVRAVLRSAQGIGYLSDSGGELAAGLEAVEDGVREWAAGLDAMRARVSV